MKKISLLVAFLWLGIMGASAQPKDNCDVNGDGVVNILDVIYVVDHVLGNHEPQAVDLGLPSMTKWASFNVGASKPEEYGDFYAWGEMEVKEEYNQAQPTPPHRVCRLRPYRAIPVGNGARSFGK